MDSSSGRSRTTPSYDPVAAILVAVVEIVLHLVAGAVAAVTGILLWHHVGWIGLLVAWIPVYVAFGLTFLLAAALMYRCLPRPRIGFLTNDRAAWRWATVSMGIQNVVSRSPARMLLLTPWAAVYYLACGMDLRGPPPLCLVWDPHLIRIGSGAVIGGETILAGHIPVPGLGMYYGRVDIGAGALIGFRCVICPGTRIGSGAVVLPGTIVSPGTSVPDGATWPSPSYSKRT